MRHCMATSDNKHGVIQGTCIFKLDKFEGNSCQIILYAAKKAGEEAAELPFNKYLKKLLDSDIADISNISSSRYGGAITAALFLERFIKEKNKEKWAHLDIAGPAFVKKAWSYHPSGASGIGVRTLVEFIRGLD